MSETHIHVPDLTDGFAIQPDSIVSRTLQQDARTKVVLFGFDAGQELSEHTAAVPAIMHFISGEADVLLGEETVKVGPQSWIHMPARLPHAITARTPVVMLLTLCKNSA